MSSLPDRNPRVKPAALEKAATLQSRGTQPVEAMLLGQTSARLPTVIPATQKRRANRPLEPAIVAQKRVSSRRLPWLIVLLTGTLTIILTFAFAIPLGTSGMGQQKTVTLAQGINNLLTTGQFNGSVNMAQHDNGLVASITTSCGGTDIWGTCARALLDNGTVGSGQLQRPIQGAIITQIFANPEYQTWCGCVKPHTGIDLAAPYGTPVTASDSGEVIWIGWDWSGLGWAVKISHGNYIATIYGHLARYIVKVGQYVTRGQTIAYEGSTGASTGPHVHFMVLVNNVWVNPAAYMQLP